MGDEIRIDEADIIDSALYYQEDGDIDETILRGGDVSVRKANFLISAKYKSTLLENKLLLLSISKCQNFEKGKDGVLVAKIRASELKEFLNANNGSFYQQLETTSRNMTGKTIGISDPEEKKFDYMAIVIRAYYENSVLTVEFNPHLEKYILGIKKNYTPLNTDIMCSFKSVFTFRLYEIIRSLAYTPKGQRVPDVYSVKQSVAELKLELGVVNSNDDKIKRLLNNSKSPDYERAVELSGDKSYDNWANFKRKVLDVAVKEMNEKSDIHIEYTTERSGVGGKVVAVNFFARYVEPNIVPKINKDEVIERIYEMCYPTIKKIKDAKTIAETADYQIDVAEKAYKYYQKQSEKGNIDTPLKYILWAIRNESDITESPESKPKKKTGKKPSKKNSFNNFEQNEYDFDELERELLSNGIRESDRVEDPLANYQCEGQMELDFN